MISVKKARRKILNKLDDVYDLSNQIQSMMLTNEWTKQEYDDMREIHGFIVEAIDRCEQIPKQPKKEKE